MNIFETTKSPDAAIVKAIDAMTTAVLAGLCDDGRDPRIVALAPLVGALQQALEDVHNLDTPKKRGAACVKLAKKLDGLMFDLAHAFTRSCGQVSGAIRDDAVDMMAARNRAATLRAADADAAAGVAAVRYAAKLRAADAKARARAAT